MPQCAVVSCSNSHRKTKGAPVRYHRFPTDMLTRAKWVKACGKIAFNTSTARICSRHFSPACYERDVQHELLGLPPRSRLRKGALPHIAVPYVFENRNNNNSEKLKTDIIKKDSGIAVLLAVGLMPARSDRKNVTGGMPQE